MRPCSRGNVPMAQPHWLPTLIVHLQQRARFRCRLTVASCGAYRYITYNILPLSQYKALWCEGKRVHATRPRVEAQAVAATSSKMFYFRCSTTRRALSPRIIPNYSRVMPAICNVPDRSCSSWITWLVGAGSATPRVWRYSSPAPANPSQAVTI